jgi:LysM repeat protein
MQPGDTGVQVARKTKTSVAQLQALNADVDWSKLKVGQVVRVR